MKKRKEIIIRWIKYLFYGISWGWSFFVLINVIGCLSAGKEYVEPVMENFVSQAMYAALVGIACGTTSIVYTFEKLPWAAQIAIHFVVGIGTYFAVAFTQNWIPMVNVWSAVIFVLMGILVFAAIWAGFYFYNRSEARRVNEKLMQMENEEAEAKKTPV